MATPSRAGPSTVPDAVYGPCSVCGQWGEHERRNRSIREGYQCPGCSASLRYRHQACVLIACFGRPGTRCLGELVAQDRMRKLRVYEPGMVGPFRRYFARLPDYTASYYWPDVPRGDSLDGVRSEDLQALTFADASFDLVVSSDIFEHVRRPIEAFAEVARVLAPGGVHVFTVPMQWPPRETSAARVDTSGPDDVLIADAVYHGSPTDPKGSLVYTDFGLSLSNDLERLGTPTEIVGGLRDNMTFVSSKQGA